MVTRTRKKGEANTNRKIVKSCNDEIMVKISLEKHEYNDASRF